MKVEILKKRDGITLIALIITIVVLLILVGVSMSLVIGNNGIINKAQEASKKTIDAENEELLKLTLLSSVGDDGNLDIEKFKSEIESQGGTIISADDVRGSWNDPYKQNNPYYKYANENFPITVETADDTGKVIFLNGEIRDVNFSDIFVYLYSDGTLKFSNTELTGYSKDYGNIKGKFYVSTANYDNNTLNSTVPWKDDKASITKVVIENEIKPLSTEGWFTECKNLISIEGLDNVDTSNTFFMSRMFSDCCSLTALNLEGWDTGNVIDMGGMFDAIDGNEMALTEIKGIENFDVSNVEGIGSMFLNCKELTTLNLSNWNTSKVINMSSLFKGCESLTLLDVSNFDTSNVVDMNSMFSKCSSVTSLNLASFDTSNVTNMNMMFNECKGLSELNVENFDTSKVNKMAGMFRYCSNLSILDLSSFNTSRVEYVFIMFAYCSNLTTLNLNNFDLSNVKTLEDVSENEQPYRYMFTGVNTNVQINTNENTKQWILDKFPTYTNITTL